MTIRSEDECQLDYWSSFVNRRQRSMTHSLQRARTTGVGDVRDAEPKMVDPSARARRAHRGQDHKQSPAAAVARDAGVLVQVVDL